LREETDKSRDRSIWGGGGTLCKQGSTPCQTLFTLFEEKGETWDFQEEFPRAWGRREEGRRGPHRSGWKLAATSQILRTAKRALNRKLNAQGPKKCSGVRSVELGRNFTWKGQSSSSYIPDTIRGEKV